MELNVLGRLDKTVKQENESFSLFCLERARTCFLLHSSCLRRTEDTSSFYLKLCLYVCLYVSMCLCADTERKTPFSFSLA